MSVGKPDDLKRLQNELETCYKVKTQLVGPHEDHMEEVKILNRIVAWHEKKGFCDEVDPRHVEIFLQQLELAIAKAVASPGTKEEGGTQQDHEEPLAE